MRKLKYLCEIAIFFLLVILCSCSGDSTNKQNQGDRNSEFAKVLEDYYQEGLKLDPLAATRQGDNRYNHIFPNYLSDEYLSKKKVYYTDYLKKINQFNDENLSESEKTSKSILQWECEIKLEGLSFRDDLFPIDQMWSRNLDVARLASGSGAQPFKTVEDYENWLQRLYGYIDWMATAESKLKAGIEAGYVLPKTLIIKVIPQLEVFAREEVEQHLFYNPVKNFPKSFTDQEKERLIKAYAAIIGEKVIPAYKSLHELMSTDYFEAGRETSGINSIPNGKANYEHRIKRYTTANMTADEIYEIGLNEVDRISAEMEKVMEQVGFEGNLKTFFDHIRDNQKLTPYTEPQQVIDNFNTIHDTMKPQLEVLFDLKPKAAFEVRRTEAFREKSASAEYNSPTRDGSRPGIFYVPIPDVTKYNVFSDEALFLHEAIPGHHYQIALTQENKELPNFRRYIWYSAYGEGWALYTESLGKELGLYTDPYQYFGMLNMEMHRAIRLVVDVGIHAKGWTREEAIQYSMENEAESEASIISEIERYMANPGQALSYKIGQIKIKELRAKAEMKLGDEFDVRQFHNQVLQTGSIPLAILEDKINTWIASYI